MKNLGDLMKTAQSIQEQMQKAQEDLARQEVTGEAGGGLVKVTLNGRHDAQRVEIDPSLMQDDREILEDLITAAINDAVRRIEQNNKDNLSKMTAGLGIPPDFKMPF